MAHQHDDNDLPRDPDSFDLAVETCTICERLPACKHSGPACADGLESVIDYLVDIEGGGLSPEEEYDLHTEGLGRRCPCPF
jgi:hypothetical protein